MKVRANWGQKKERAFQAKGMKEHATFRKRVVQWERDLMFHTGLS
jgi:hypothetical protein